MTDDAQIQTAAITPPDRAREARAIAIGVAGMGGAGLGHALQKMWGRADNVFSWL